MNDNAVVAPELPLVGVEHEFIELNEHFVVFRSSQANNQQIRREPQDRPKAFARASAHCPRHLFENRQQEAMRDTVKPVSCAARATGERVMHLRIYVDAEGETHMEEVDVALMPRAILNGHPPLRLTQTLAGTGCNICGCRPKWEWSIGTTRRVANS